MDLTSTAITMGPAHTSAIRGSRSANRRKSHWVAMVIFIVVHRPAQKTSTVAVRLRRHTLTGGTAEQLWRGRG